MHTDSPAADFLRQQWISAISWYLVSFASLSEKRLREYDQNMTIDALLQLFLAMVLASQGHRKCNINVCPCLDIGKVFMSAVVPSALFPGARKEEEKEEERERRGRNSD